MNTTLANRAISAAHSKNDRARNRLEFETGDSLSTILDACWADAEEEEDWHLADRLEKAYNHLTGSTS